MSSTHKFPSGLNNWTGSDKPIRTDFVRDNEILDENAMWKAAYDEGGVVAQAGGIADYALAKDTYDADGTVAELGGIMAAVATNDGITLYTHNKAGTTHTLASTRNSDNIKFIATDDFTAGDTLFINGAAVDVLDSDGAPAGSAFRSGDVVMLLRNGDAAWVLVPSKKKVNQADIEGLLFIDDTERQVGWYMVGTNQRADKQYKPLYEKLLDDITIPNATMTVMQHNIPNTELIWFDHGQATSVQGTVQVSSVQYAAGVTYTIGIDAVTKSAYRISASYNAVAQNTKASLYFHYTKSTDTPKTKTEIYTGN